MNGKTKKKSTFVYISMVAKFQLEMLLLIVRQASVVGWWVIIIIIITIST